MSAGFRSAPPSPRGRERRGAGRWAAARAGRPGALAAAAEAPPPRSPACWGRGPLAAEGGAGAPPGAAGGALGAALRVGAEAGGPAAGGGRAGLGWARAALWGARCAAESGGGCSSPALSASDLSAWREAAAPACGGAAGACRNSTWMETFLLYSEIRVNYTASHASP